MAHHLAAARHPAGNSADKPANRVDFVTIIFLKKLACKHFQRLNLEARLGKNGAVVIDGQAVKFQVSPGWMATGGVSGRTLMSTAIVISPAAPEFWTWELKRPMGAARHSNHAFTGHSAAMLSRAPISAAIISI